MLPTILLLILYIALLKKFKKSLLRYEEIVANRTTYDYYIDYCDEPICLR